MLGPRPDKDQGGRRKRKWEEEGGPAYDDEEDGEAPVTNQEIEEWKARENLAEQHAQTKGGSQDRSAPPPSAPPAPPPPMMPVGGPPFGSAPGMMPGGPFPGMMPGAPPPPGLMAPPMALPGMLPPGMLPLPPGMPPMGMVPMGMLPPSMLPAKVGPGMRLGEGDDNGRSRDEIRVIKEMLAEDIQTFILANRIDANAARDLRVEPVHVQFAVLDRGPLTSCVNPSGALIGRIRDAKKGVRLGSAGGPPVTIHQPLPPSALGPAAGAQPPPPGGPPSGALVGPMRSFVGAPGPMSPEMERFIMDNRLDDGAVMALRSEPKEVQDKVISMGPLVNATNPSAALMGRIRSQRTNVLAGLAGVPRPAPPPMPSLPPPPQYSQPPPAHGPGGYGGPDLNSEAMKAIRALTAREGGGAPPPGPNTSGGGGMGLGSGASMEDTQLQAEALKAIQQINMADL